MDKDIKSKNGIQHIGDDKGDHDHQDGVGSSHLWGASVVPSGGVNALHFQLVPVQEKHHGATGPDQETNKHDIRDGPQDDKVCVVT